MPRGPVTYTTLSGVILRDTAKAVRFKIEQPEHCLDGEAFWFPFSQIKVFQGGEGELDRIECPDWLIEAKVSELAQNAGD